MIKSVEVSIGSQMVDKQFGDWLNFWNELTLGDNGRRICAATKIQKYYRNWRIQKQRKAVIVISLWYLENAYRPGGIGYLRCMKQFNNEISKLDK